MHFRREADNKKEKTQYKSMALANKLTNWSQRNRKSTCQHVDGALIY